MPSARRREYPSVWVEQVWTAECARSRGTEGGAGIVRGESHGCVAGRWDSASLRGQYIGSVQRA